jgi:hypothetical protein
MPDGFLTNLVRRVTDADEEDTRHGWRRGGARHEAERGWFRARDDGERGWRRARDEADRGWSRARDEAERGWSRGRDEAERGWFRGRRAADDGYRRVRGLAGEGYDRARDLAEEGYDRVRDLADEGYRRSRDARGELRRLWDQLEEVVESRIAPAAGSYARQGLHYGRDAAESLRDVARHRPLLAIGVAVAATWVVASLIRGSRRH